MLIFDNVTFAYTDSVSRALNGVGFSISPGERVCLLGANGSGKSTLARLANGLLLPASGRVEVDGFDTANHSELRALRQRVGVVAQDPDTQIINTTVRDEVAFAPQNLGVARDEILRRVGKALSAVGMPGFDERDPNTLSGGEKQRLVIAGILAMQPQYIVFDEPTSMLDPEGRAEVLGVIRDLRKHGCGILHITHDLKEIEDADKVVVLSGGKAVYDGGAAGLMADDASLEKWGLVCHGSGRHSANREAVAQNPNTGGSHESHGDGSCGTPARHGDGSCGTRYRTSSPCLITSSPWKRESLPNGMPITGDSRLRGNDGGNDDNVPQEPSPWHDAATDGASDTVADDVVLDGVSYAYDSGTQREHIALHDVSMRIRSGTITLVRGHTGSGKSTLMRIAAGLLEPTSGTATVRGEAIRPGRIGIVFQNPESQLFADTVEDDIAFGPRNMGLLHKAGDKAAIVADALAKVGLDAKTFAARSPFTLSGGEARRVAIAGVLAMQCNIMLFDEPTAGLDARGRAFVCDLVCRLAQDGRGIVVVSHDVDLFSPLADGVVSLDKGVATWR